MDIKSKSVSGLEQLIHIFDKPLAEDEINCSVTHAPNLDKLFEEDMKKYSEYLTLPNWREVVLGLEKGVDEKCLKFLIISSYYIQALRKGKAEGIVPVLVEGLILTDDNKFVYGIRGGNVEKGKACIAPAGTMAYLPNNVIFSNFYGELNEELGVGKEKIRECKLVGYQTDPDFTKGINFILFGKTRCKSSELEEIHTDALAVYQNLEDKSVNNARQAIKDKGLPNIDAWEHDKLVFVENNPYRIKDIIVSRKIEDGGKQYSILDIGRGPLILYMNHPLKRKLFK